VLDIVKSEYAPKGWKGKHAGSVRLLEYIKKHQPKYVICGHIHEAKGVKKLGKTTVINAGCCGDWQEITVG
jgi:Icc-related predicted phosphoesterase